MRVTYTSNNSGGSWWLKDEDWHKLEKAGWQVEWVKDDPFYKSWKAGERWLGALAKEASKEFDTPRDAMIEFEALTGQQVTDEGCNCCGAPHEFSWGEGDKRDYASGEDCFRILHGTEIDRRRAIELLKEKGLI